MTEVYYRIRDRRNVSFDPDTEQSFYHDTDVELVKYEVISHTPKGLWIKDTSTWKMRRFILNDAVKKFAHPTLPLAEKSFRARKARQIKIHMARVQSARDALASLDTAIFNRIEKEKI